MAEHNVKINVKTDTGYDQLYPKTKSDIVDFDKTSSNLSSTNVEAAIKEVNTKANTATSTANTNKTNIGTLTSLTTDSKTNLVGAINEVDSHANTATSTSNTNKTNIGTLTSLKTAIKTNIVNAINSLYDNIIGKTLKTLDEVKLVTEEGFYVDALAIAELNKINYEKLECKPGTYLNEKNSLVIYLYKTGNIVSCSIECVASLPLGTISIDEISIPIGYRPKIRKTIPYINVDNGSVKANGGEWIIESTGSILVASSDTSFIERYSSMSWITGD